LAIAIFPFRVGPHREGEREQEKLDVMEYPESGMEAIWKIEVEDLPAFVLVNDKGNDCFRQILH
jgi:fumarate hydratase, class I